VLRPGRLARRSALDACPVGEEGKKLSGVAQLKREWCARFGDNVSRVNKAAFDALVRE
jgi:hypothetical protein